MSRYLLLLCGVLLSASAQPFLTDDPMHGPVFTDVSPASADDTFDRSNSNPISNPASDGVSTWISGPAALNDVQIQSNWWLASANTSGSVISFPTFSPDQKASAYSISGAGVGILCRAQTNYGGAYLLYVSSSTGFQFYRCTNGGSFVTTQIGATVACAAIKTTDKITFTVSGSSPVTLSVLTNDVLIASQTDTNATGQVLSGQPGLYGNSSKYINNFSASDL